MIVEYQCEWCGKHVRKRRSPATLRGTQPRFCSQACNGASRKGTGAGPTPNHEYDCVVCGKRCQVYRSPSAQTPVTCSLACTGIKQRGAGNGSYSGGRHHADNGYVRVLAPDHPGADSRGYVWEHRLVMEQKIGRRLRKGEVVHHINHIRDDNRPENLQLFASHSEHIQHHHAQENADV